MRFLFVIVFICSGAWAQEEIGKPYLYIEQGNIDGGVIAPDGRSFYTLKNGLVTQWQLQPIEKLTSFRIDTNETSRDKGYLISVTRDNKEIIIYSREGIELWDIESKKRLQTLKEKSWLGINSKYGFITLSKSNQLKIWDEKTLKLMKTSQIDYRYVLGEDESPYWTAAMNMLAGDNMLLVSYPDGEVFYDLDSFVIADKFTYDENATKYFDKYQEKFTCELYSFLKKLGPKTSNSFHVYPNKSDIKKRDELIFRTSRMKSIFVQIEHDGDQCGDRNLITFRQYGDAWLLYIYGKKYMGPENVKKYLKMKTKSGEIIPMNDATYEKYSGQILLKSQ